MTTDLEIKIYPDNIENNEFIEKEICQKLGWEASELSTFQVLRRSIDARSKYPHFLLRVRAYKNETPAPEPALLDQLQNVEDKPAVIIVGAGPAGYFAALELIELGLKPIIFDRGKDVRARRKDLRAIQQFGIVNPDSNYCFGEGGAGTYSDGKLYTRSHKRGNIYKSLKLFVEHGASSDILIDAHPHIGSNRLPRIIANMRATIKHLGGEIHFDSLVTDFILKDKRLLGVVVNNKDEHYAKATLLATGHSARDIFYALNENGIIIEAKPFALGVRIEHPQSFVDKSQYHQEKRHKNLPAASYKLNCQVEGRGVFSFCMCPGGLVVPAATAPGEIVVNGMSMSRRDSAFANSGVVTSIELEDLKDYSKFGVFAGLEFQKRVEQTMFNAGDGSQKAPAQRIPDFINHKTSATLSSTSYIPGLFSAPLHELLPKSISRRLNEGVLHFNRKMKGYYSSEANVIGTESRTSSPIRVPRDRNTFMHVETEGLFPCGEGAGYAGGIISAAMDGQNVAKAIKKYFDA